MHADLIATRAGLGQLDSHRRERRLIADCSALTASGTGHACASDSPTSGNSHFSRNTPNAPSMKRSRSCSASAPQSRKRLGEGSLPSRRKPRSPRAQAPTAVAKEPAAPPNRPAPKEAAEGWRFAEHPGFRGVPRTNLGTINCRAARTGTSDDNGQDWQRANLMSSWEVTAFVSEDSPAADDLRRAVVARAIVTAASESATGERQRDSLERALSIARVEVSRLQERVDVAKQTKDTESAVNLGHQHEAVDLGTG